ncbi:MAG: HigA family addiction module antidote protein [Bacteroidales bacterium]|nr:HigA family addiction module antidote protein [Bacteroidales bacterium]
MTDKINQFFPDEVFHPGETLSEKLSEEKMSLKEFAMRCDMSEKTINEIVKGKASISYESSMKFENVLGIPAYFWIKRQSEYDGYRARLDNIKQLEGSVEWAKQFPVLEMEKKGWIAKGKNFIEKTSFILRFFGLSSSIAWEGFYLSQELRTAFRISLKQVQNPYAVSAWLRKGDIDFRDCEVKNVYNKKLLEDSLPKIRAIMVAQPDDFFSQLQNVCSEVGIVLLHTPCLTNAPISGATRWVGDVPLIQISCRFKRSDNFWFSFFHELGHILLHGKKDVFLEFDKLSVNDKEKEDEADQFATKMTFSKELESKFIDENDIITHDSIVSFAKKYKLHPSLIVGRLQHKEIIKYSQFRELLTSIEII